ncbi:ABC transporter permease [Clostridium oryzae]|uniref:Putative multiple-sugar transport system permease YteP n=1 Tax=Clostridium oryzae TaxID=1450648 RepID=A0A1V4IEX4_9CLOT|nr:putative multiple-sugar transport system permease YteP [Clostridium oryzae]
MNLTPDTIKSETIKPQHKRSNQKYVLFFMALPFLILVFVFSYLPLYGWKYAFYDYRPGIPLSQSSFVGLQWFKSLISNPTQRAEVIRVLENTFAMSTLGIVTSFIPLLFAVFLIEVKSERFKKLVQTLTTIPNFISWVLVFSFAFTLFSVDNGIVNKILISLGIIHKGINFLASDSHTWLTMCLWGLWKGVGYSAIMYLAAVTGIDQEMYEAARVDGAGRFRIMWSITIPSLLPTFFVLLLLSIGNFMNNGMDQYFVFQNSFNKNHIEVLDLYVYNIGFNNGGTSFSLATAISMLKSIVSVVLLFFANTLSKLLRGESLI